MKMTSSKRLLTKTLMLACLICTVPFASFAQKPNPANRELTYALAEGHLNLQEYDQALRLLNRHLSQDEADHSSWFILAKIQMQQKNYAQAENAFRKAAGSSEVNEETRAQYLYQAANAQALEGNIQQANLILQEVINSAPSIQGLGAQVERIKAVLRAGQPLPPLKVTIDGEEAGRDKLRFLFGLRSGYDSNVLLLPDDTNGVSPGSAFISPSVIADGALPVSAIDLKGRSVTNFTAYSAEASRTFNTIFQSLNFEWNPRAIKTEKLSPAMGSRLDMSFVNSDGMEFFSWTGTGYANAMYTIDEVSSVVADLPIGYQRFPGVVTLDSADRRDGLVISPTAMYRRRIDVWSLSGGANYQEALTKGRNFKARTVGAVVGASRPLPFMITGRTGLSYNRVNYHESVSSRRDNRIDLSFGLSKVMPFNKRISVNADYIFSSNDSTVTTATYERHTAFLQVTYAL